MSRGPTCFSCTIRKGRYVRASVWHLLACNDDSNVAVRTALGCAAELAVFAGAGYLAFTQYGAWIGAAAWVAFGILQVIIIRADWRRRK